MKKVLIKYTKLNRMKFLSHLELIRVVERALRRAEIPLKFSQGFNPHPKISFAAPLPVGVSSEGEYMHIELEREIDLDKFRKKINLLLPSGIKFILIKYVDEKADSLMSIVNYGSYAVKCPIKSKFNNVMICKAMENFLKKEEIPYEKRSNKTKKVKIINIREMIKDLYLLDYDEEEFYLKMVLATGSRGNLKPEVVIEKLKNFEDLDIDISKTRYHRIELFAKTKDGITPIEDIY